MSILHLILDLANGSPQGSSIDAETASGGDILNWLVEMGRGGVAKRQGGKECSASQSTAESQDDTVPRDSLSADEPFDMSRSNVEGGAASLKSSVSLIGSASTARSQVSLVTSTSSSLATDDSVCSSTSTTPLADKQSSTAMIDPPDNTSNLTSALRYEPYVVITSEEPNLAGLSHVYCRLTASATIDIDELERAPSIQLTEMIGYGGTGMVCRDQTGKLAVKLVVPFVGLEPEAYDQRLHETLSEDRFLTSLPGQFPSCTPMFHGLFAAVDSKKRIYLALLFDLIEGDTFDSWTDLKKHRHACLEAVNLLHRAHICHGDLHPPNFILQANGDVKIVDYARAHAHARPEELESERERFLACIADA